jgi:hypothetical protein
MARGRMISNTLGRSHKFNALSSHLHKLVYVLTLTHADAEGRVEADPRLICADSFALDSGVTPEQVQSALAELARVGLIRLYAAGGKAYAEFVDFHDHNTISRVKEGPDTGKPSKEAESEIPAPTGELPEWANPKARTPEPVGSNAGPTPEQRRVTPPEFEFEFELESKPKEILSSDSPLENPDPRNDVAQARRARVNYQDFLEAYNQHRRTLPAAVNLSKKRKHLLARLVKEHGDAALPLLVDATREVAADGFWREKRYNLDNLLTVDGRVVEKAEKYQASHSATSTEQLPPPGTVVEHPSWGQQTIREHTRRGELVLSNGAAVAASEVTPCRN